jgi:hypothetical protein
MSYLQKSNHNQAFYPSSIDHRTRLLTHRSEHFLGLLGNSSFASQSIRRSTYTMKFAQATKYLLLLGASQAFAPVHRFSPSQIAGGATSARSMAVDPHFFNEIPNHMQSLQDAFSTFSLSDAMPDADAVAATVDEVAKSDNGWFGFLTTPIEFLLQAIHSALVNVGLSANAWGLTIIFMTAVIKLATFPLTKTQLESTNKMQVSKRSLIIGCLQTIKQPTQRSHFNIFSP